MKKFDEDPRNDRNQNRPNSPALPSSIGGGFVRLPTSGGLSRYARRLDVRPSWETLSRKVQRDPYIREWVKIVETEILLGQQRVRAEHEQANSAKRANDMSHRDVLIAGECHRQRYGAGPVQGHSWEEIYDLVAEDFSVSSYTVRDARLRFGKVWDWIADRFPVDQWEIRFKAGGNAGLVVGEQVISVEELIRIQESID